MYVNTEMFLSALIVRKINMDHFDVVEFFSKCSEGIKIAEIHRILRSLYDHATPLHIRFMDDRINGLARMIL